MVSLGEDANRSRSQFKEEQREEDDYLSDSTTLSLVMSMEQTGRNINTTFVIVAHIILLIAVWVLAFVLPHVITSSDKVSAFSLMVYIMGGIWVVQFIIDRFYRQQHYHSRLYGYLSFYRRTRNIRRLPLLFASAANTVMLISTEVIRKSCADTCGHLSRENCLQIIISIASVLQILCLIVYLVRTVNFNKSKVSPDVHQEEFHTNFLQTNSSSGDIGFKDENLTDQVLERQADMIRYLKNHSSQLAKKIVTLNEELKSLKRGQ